MQLKMTSEDKINYVAILFSWQLRHRKYLVANKGWPKLSESSEMWEHLASRHKLKNHVQITVIL